MSVINSIREWIASECYLLDDFRELFVDYLGADASYSVEGTPSDPVVKRYTNGAEIRRKQFSFCSRVVYDGLENIDTSDFFEKFQEWMEECDKYGILPSLDGNRTSTKIKALTDGYLFDENGKNGQYRIQCELQYFMEAKNGIS